MRHATVQDLLKFGGIGAPKPPTYKQPSEAPRPEGSKPVAGGFGTRRNVVPAPAGLADASAAAPATQPLKPKPVIDVLHGHGNMKCATVRDLVKMALAAPEPTFSPRRTGHPFGPSPFAANPAPPAMTGPGGDPWAPGGSEAGKSHAPSAQMKSYNSVVDTVARGGGSRAAAAKQVMPRAAEISRESRTDPFGPQGMAGDKPMGPSVVAPGSHAVGKNIVRDTAGGKDPFGPGGKLENVGTKSPQQQQRWGSFEKGVAGGRQSRATGDVINPLKGNAQAQADKMKGIQIGYAAGKPNSPSIGAPMAATPKPPTPTGIGPTAISGGNPTPPSIPKPMSMRPPSQGGLVDPFKTASAWSKMGLHKVADKIDDDLHRQGKWMEMPPAERRAAHPEWKNLNLGQTAAKGRSAPANPPPSWSPGSSTPVEKPPAAGSFGAPQAAAIRQAKTVSSGGSANVQETKKELGADFMGHGKMSHAVTGKGSSGWS